MGITDLKLKKGQNICFLNVRSLYNHFSELELDFSNTKFVALCLSESWLNNRILNDIIQIKGYKIVRLDRNYGKKGGGVMAYIREDLSFEMPDLSWNISNLDIETLTFVVRQNHQRDLYVTVVYLPPKSGIEKALDILSNIGEIISYRNVEWILGGDLNIDITGDITSKKKGC